MIVTKEDGNSYYVQYSPLFDLRVSSVSPEYLALQEKIKPKREAFKIDEASMGDPWTEFGKWFVERFNNHVYGLADVLMMAKNQDDINRMQHEVGSQIFTEADYLSVEKALETMVKRPDLNKQEALDYLKGSIGLHIATENW